MNIYCPKCNTCYSIDRNLIPAAGKKLRCQRCGEIWIYKLDDSEETDSTKNLQETTQNMQEQIPSEDSAAITGIEEKEVSEVEIVPSEIPEKLPENTPQNIAANGDEEAVTTPSQKQQDSDVVDEEMNKIFSRLKDETDKISTEKNNLSKGKKIFSTIKKILGWNSRLIISLEIIAIILMIGLGAFALRFELVRKFPQLESLFGEFGIQSKVIGEGLDFQNVTRNYVSENNKTQLNIKGFIVNTTDSELEVPTVVVNFLTNEGDALAQTQHKLETSNIKSGEKIPFNILTETPPENAKFVVLTFQ